MNNLNGQSQYAAAKGKSKQFDNLLRGASREKFFAPEGMKDGTITTPFEQVEYNSAGLDPGTLLPGDQVWIKNPAWWVLPQAERDDANADGGSNKIYIGDGVYATPYGRAGMIETYTLDQMKWNVTEYAGKPKFEDLNINRIHRPLVPNW